MFTASCRTVLFIFASRTIFFPVTFQTIPDAECFVSTIRLTFEMCIHTGVLMNKI